MVLSLCITGFSLAALVPAHTYGQFAILMALRGAFRPLYRVGSDAMIADLAPPKKRTEAYSLTRLAKNVGVALGPALGGFLNDTFNPSTIWYGGGTAGFLGAIIFFVLATRTITNGIEITAD